MARGSSFERRSRRDAGVSELGKAIYWRDYKRRHGPAAGIRIAEELRLQVLGQRATWPTERERAEDHAAHARVLDALERALPRSR